MTMTSTMIDKIETAREQYLNDGAAVIQGVIDSVWIDRMQRAVDGMLNSESKSAVEYTPKDKAGRFYGDFFLWRRNKVFRSFALDSILPEIAQHIMKSERVDFFYDQLLVKEPGTTEPTPLHQDLPYWPLRGEQIMSIWVPFDPVTPQSGVVHYLKGSHKWNKFYAPEVFAADSGFSDVYAGLPYEKIESVREKLGEYEKITWSLEPGDVIIHHPLTLHYAPGNKTKTIRRRALALRYTGDDVRYDDRPGTFLKNPKLLELLPPISLLDGDPIECDLFPRII